MWSDYLFFFFEHFAFFYDYVPSCSYFQVCLEGQISRKSSMKSLSEGRQPFGDQIPWKFCEQFQDDVFPSLSGARIVRIAVHPNALGVHYSGLSIAVMFVFHYFLYLCIAV